MVKDDYDQDEQYKSEDEDEKEQTDYGDNQSELGEINGAKNSESENDSLDDGQIKFINNQDQSEQSDNQDQITDQLPTVFDEFGVVDLYNDNSDQKSNTQRITSPYMSKYEKAMILGKRADQISKGAPIYANQKVQSLKHMNPLQIAQTELQQKKLPFILRRFLPDGSFDDWKISQLLWIQVD